MRMRAGSLKESAVAFCPRPGQSGCDQRLDAEGKDTGPAAEIDLA